MKIFKKVVVVIMGSLGLMVYAAYQKNSHTSITNDPLYTHQSSAFLRPSALPLPMPQGMQVIRSILDLEVQFLNGDVNYPGLSIVNDPRYQALGNNEKLVDAIRFQPMQGSPFLLLVAIAKNQNGGAPLIVPGKFNIMHKTEQEGVVLRDNHGRLFYYSGYILATPAWKDIAPGQILQDKFCKNVPSMTTCSRKDTVNVLLKKPADPAKDIPLLAFIP